MLRCLHRFRCRSTAAACWRAIASSTRRARSWASAASARAAGCCCCRASTTTIRCSCRSRRPSRRCWRPMSTFPWRTSNQGQRVVVGSGPTQGSPDIFLGWGEAEGKHFYVRQLADMKGSATFAEGNREGIERLDRILRPVRLGAGAGPCQVGRPGDDRRLLRHLAPRSTTRSPSSRWPMPGRPNRTTPHSTRRAAPAASRRLRVDGWMPEFGAPPALLARCNRRGGALGATPGLADIRAASGRRLRRQPVGATAGRPAGQELRPAVARPGRSLRLSLGPLRHDAAARRQSGGRRVGTAGYNTFIRVEGPPGQIDIACKVGDSTANGQVQIQGGQTRFVEVSMNSKWG